MAILGTMSDYSVFDRRQPLGWAVRQLLRLVPDNVVLPILSGPNRSMKWVTGSMKQSGNIAHTCWLGVYEKANASLLIGLCEPGMIVFDVGANAGYFTLLFSRAVGPKGRVFAFEPDPKNLELLRRHLSLNATTNVTIVPAAVADQEGETRFESAGPLGHISKSGTLSVKTCRLDDFPTPDLVKMDIEGGEIAALIGAKTMLAKRRTTWFVERHSNDDIPEILSRHGYSATPVANIWDGGFGYVLAKPS